jgi:hypothetical protein
MSRSSKIISLIIVSTILFSCQKQLNNKTGTLQVLKSSLTIPDNFFKETPVPGVVQNSIKSENKNTVITPSVAAIVTPIDPNNGDEQVLLGNQLPNPYTVANMQQTYNILYGTGQTLSANYLYVKFKPANVDELQTLEDNSDLELQDYPMDYELTQDGD